MLNGRVFANFIVFESRKGFACSDLEAAIKSAASAASLRGGRASGRLDHVFFCASFERASGQEVIKIQTLQR